MIQDQQPPNYTSKPMTMYNKNIFNQSEAEAKAINLVLTSHLIGRKCNLCYDWPNLSHDFRETSPKSKTSAKTCNPTHPILRRILSYRLIRKFQIWMWKTDKIKKEHAKNTIFMTFLYQKRLYT